MKKRKLANAALIIAIISVVGWLIPIVGIPLSIIGFVLGICSFSSNEVYKSTAAIVICIVTLAAGGINSYIGYHNAKTQAESTQSESVTDNQTSRSFRRKFMESCTATESNVYVTCSCMADFLENNYTTDELEYIDQNVNSPEVKEIGNAAIAQCT